MPNGPCNLMLAVFLLIPSVGMPETAATPPDPEQMSVSEAAHARISLLADEFRSQAIGLVDRKFDWRDAEKQIAEFTRNYPGYPEAVSPDSPLRRAALQILQFAERESPESASAVCLRFKGSSLVTLRQLAAGCDALLAARNTPLTMRFTAIDGQEIDLAKLRGKTVLIQFWGVTWCGACKIDLPLLNGMYRKYRAQGLEIIGITFNERLPEQKMQAGHSLRDVVLEKLEKLQVTWPQYLGEDSQELVTRFNVISAPTYLLLDKNGLLVSRTRPLTHLEAVIRRQLGLAPLKPGDEKLQLGSGEPAARAEPAKKL